MQNYIKRWLNPRFAFLYPFVVYLVIFARAHDHSLLGGSVLIVAGMAIRIWSNGYAIKMDRLTTSGPYAYVRNPLYLGTLLIVLGFLFILQSLYVGLGVCAVMALVYLRTIRNEEKMLSEKFGKAYSDYRAAVPALVPGLKAYAGGDKWPFSFERLWNSREYKVVFWLVIMVLVAHLKDEIIVEREAPDFKIVLTFVVIALLAAGDLILECVRHSLKRQGSVVKSQVP